MISISFMKKLIQNIKKVLTKRIKRCIIKLQKMKKEGMKNENVFIKPIKRKRI